MTHVIASWLYADAPGEDGHYPQVRGRSSSTKFHDVYLRCLAVGMATSVRNNPGARHVVVVNTDRVWQSPTGAQTRSLLSDLSVSVQMAPFAHRPPSGWHHAWQNQFYLFDVIE